MLKQTAIAAVAALVVVGAALYWLSFNPQYVAAYTLSPAPTADELGLTVDPGGTSDLSVTGSNWLYKPHNRLGVRHAADVLHTITVPRGDGPVSMLPPADPAAIDIFAGVTIPGADDLDTHLEGTNTDAIVVLKDGRLVHEQYLNGQTAADRHALMSVTKSFTGLIAEMLLAEGVLDDTQLVSHYVPELADSAWGDATVRQVMDMEVGINWNEDYADPDSDISHFIYASGTIPWPWEAAYSSLYEFLPSISKQGDHGEFFQYVTATTEALGWVIRRATGKPFEELMFERLYSRLGAEHDAYYIADAEDTVMTGGGLNTSVRDLARLAQLVANRGGWQSEQVVDAAIIDKIRAGGDPSHYNQGLSETASYKSQWYVDAPLNKMTAVGIHGQMIYIDFANNLVIVQQSSNPDAVGMFYLNMGLFFEAVSAAYGAAS